jgi:transposase
MSALRREIRTQLGEEPPARSARPERLTEEQRKAWNERIRALAAEGQSQSKIAEEVGVAQRRVSSVLRSLTVS